jgi:hypothetical protein
VLEVERLAVRERSNGAHPGRVRGCAEGKVDRSRREEAGGSVFATLAIHELQVVGCACATPVRRERAARYSSKARFQAAAWTAAVSVTTPSMSKMTAT